ncbi:MAG: hypothetical protein EOO88_01310 [Pedobacter sp.]|nr:MAG: hypothetical protein EOO88_01310 [Pedobacter sp.]
MKCLPGKLNGRQLFYLKIEESVDALRAAQLDNWVLLVIEDNAENPILWEFANLCIEKHLLYMVAVGLAGSEIDDLFDFAILEREFDHYSLPKWMKSDNDVLMTAWFDDFEEAVWFIFNSAYYEDHVIDTVLIVNLTRESREADIAQLISKFEEMKL